MQKKTVLITGASSGIGLATCQRFLTAGYQVGIIDKDPLPESLKGAEQEGRIIFVQGRAADEKAASELVTRMRKDWGSIQALVNNVGVFKKIHLTELGLDEWKEILDTNLTSYFLFAKLSAPDLKKARGSIVNIASTRALQSEADTEAYSASKGGIVALTHALAISLGPDVRVNCISPGWIDTRDPSEKKKAPLKPRDHAQHPAGRVGEPEDIANFVHWLVNEEKGFVTGQNFILDGGMTRKMIYED
ncbi:MAG TPA: SDR family oxidoreductase [Oligoflexus sp.]|uniref:SDR family oxidoreductase n=1 Tax=Oligoflexus sp. TaxID=1971216 RepID=UPI002D80B8BB|nr:SDR family oxidoreductase [Oligoflexus sp.]HET9238348.1 SDR family oxidoreductase [Oligoflexus sp.]